MATLGSGTLTILGLLLSSSMLNAHAVDFLTRQFPWAVAGEPYDEKIETIIDGRCPRGDVILQVFGGSLPNGIEIIGERLVGVPTTPGIYPVMIRASNGCGFEVKGYQFVVATQASLKVEPAELKFEYRDGYAKPLPQSLLVFSNWPSVPYAVELKEPWLNLAYTGITPGLGAQELADHVAARVNTKTLKPGVYHATLKFSTPLSGSAPTVQVTLTVGQ